MLRNGFAFVYEDLELEKVMAFLSKGFLWNQRFLCDMTSFIKHQKVDGFPIAAANWKDGEIDIAILVIPQGFKFKGREVVNLSAWYALPSKRGVAVFNFAKNLINGLKSSVLTNFTPNASAGRIFKKLGFVRMNITYKTYGLKKRFPYLDITGLSQFLGKKCERFIHLADAYHNDENRSTLYRFDTKKFLGIQYKILNIYDFESGCPGFYQLLRLSLKHRCLKWVYYSSSEFSHGVNVPWLLFSTDDSADFSNILGSELCVFS